MPTNREVYFKLLKENNKYLNKSVIVSLLVDTNEFDERMKLYLNFDKEDKAFKKYFAELEGKRYIKTLFEKDEDYIAIQDSLARLDLEAAKKKVQYDRTYESLESSVNRNFDYIKNLEESLKKLED